MTAPRSVEHDEDGIRFLYKTVEIGIREVVQVFSSIKASPLFFRARGCRRLTVLRIVGILHELDKVGFLRYNKMRFVSLSLEIKINWYRSSSTVRPTVLQVVEIDERGETLDIVDLAEWLMDGAVHCGECNFVVILEAGGSSCVLRFRCYAHPKSHYYLEIHY